MSVYPGNSSLSTAVKDRVASTFQQTLTLYKQGRTDEVVAGCNLILQMDPLFDPARKLLEKTKNPNAPIDVDRLTAATTVGGGLEEAKAAMAARDFERVVHITTEILTNDLMNDEARLLSDQAREKMEAAPFIDQFARKCQQHVTDGNLPAARADLDKARALDPTHPTIAQMQQMISAKETAAPTFDASSFVVDTPASPAARGTAQAADFGFTFEEDKGQAPKAETSFANFSFDTPAASASPDAPFGGGFSFDTPVASEAPAAPAFGGPEPAKTGNEFDFSTASIETSPEDQKKIEQYLVDGDRAFDGGDYQQAIDLWSRIFLIDVTNEAASERIEKAKAKRREAEARIDGILAAGVAAFEKKDFVTARAKFNEVLQIDPNHSSAQDYIEQIDRGGAVVPPTETGSSFGSVLDDESAVGTYDAPMASPEPIAAPSAPRKTPSAKAAPAAPKKKSSMGLIAAAVILLLVGAGGYFAWTKLRSVPEPVTASTSGVITRASTLSQQGKFDEAIALLQDIKPGDTQYDAALAMIADLQQKKARAATTVDGRPATEFYDENLAAGHAAFASGDYVVAKKSFENAMRVKALPPDAKAAYDTAAQQVAKLATARTLFTEGNYQQAVVQLEALQRQDPNNRSIQRMIIDAHFNTGATALREARIDDAVQAFERVLALDPNDELARRSRDIARRYQGQQKDLLYSIYVKYLPLRQPAA
jgi:tetratricopeptide (TPR) repeat protein